MKKVKIIVIIVSLMLVNLVTACDGTQKNNGISTTSSIENSSKVVEGNSAPIPSDDEILALFEKAKKMAYMGDYFELGTDKVFYEKNTHQTIKEYLDSYHTIFTERYVSNVFDLGGYEPNTSDGGSMIIMNIPKNQVEWYDRGSGYRYFDDITDNSNYIGYDEVVIGGHGDRGSDMSFVSNKIAIIDKTEKKIVIRNTIQHNHIDNDPKYVCHMDNGHVIIDGTYDGLDNKSNMPIIKDTSLKGTILSPNDKTRYWLETSYDYNLILEDGKWKFDNFVEWG